MRICELLLILATLAACYFLRFPIRGISAWTLVALFVLALCQLFIEQFRWQMTTVYLAIFLIALVIARSKQFEDGNDSKNLKRVRIYSAVIALAGALFCVAVPVNRLPAPSGNYEIGTRNYCFTDLSRRELFDRAQGPRLLPIQIWYPSSKSQRLANNSKSNYAPYMMPCSDFQGLMQAALPAILASHLHLIESNSCSAAPLAPNLQSAPLEQGHPWPVIIFSHGLMGGRIQNTLQCEELASHGYIVVAIDHTYDASFAIFPDGHVICSQLLTGSSADLPRIQTHGFGVRVADVIFVIDELEKLNKRDPEGIFTDKIDLNRIGLMGHSFGGATTVEVTAIDKRVRAGLCMDGGVRNVTGSAKPIMIMQSDHGDRDALGIEKFRKVQIGELYNVIVPGSGHANFTDLPMLTPLHWLLCLSGPIKPERCEEIINAYSLAFFEKHLKGTDSELMLAPSPKFPELQIEFNRAANIAQ